MSPFFAIKKNLSTNDHLLPPLPRSDERNRDSRLFLYKMNHCLGICRKFFKQGDTGCRTLPPWKFAIQRFSVFFADANRNDLFFIQYIQLCDVPAIETVDLRAAEKIRNVQPAASTRTFGDGTILAAALAQSVANFSLHFREERTGANARAVGFRHADAGRERFGWEPKALERTHHRR